jgi:hypothetical protein
MKRYFVKVISTAKASNSVHSRVVMCNVCGSRGVHVASTVTSDPNSCLKNIHTFDNLKRSDIAKSGFTNCADAEKYAKFKNTLCNKFYDFDTSIVSVDV